MINYNPIPVLLQIGSLKIYSYGVMLAIAFLLSLFLILKQAKKRKINEKHIYNLFLYIAVFSLFFSRLFYCILNFNSFNSILEFFEIWKGGSVSIGVLFGAIFGAFVYSKRAKLDFLVMLDLFAPYFALSSAIGRIGCFLRGCCFGIPTSLPWGILYGAGSLASMAGFAVPLHPTQIYHALADLTIFFILLKATDKKNNPKGYIITLFIALFSLQRFLIDFLRYHAKSELFYSIPIFQIVYGMVFLVSLIFLIKMNKKR